MSNSAGNETLEWLAKQRLCIKGKVKEIDHVDNQFQSKNANKVKSLFRNKVEKDKKANHRDVKTSINTLLEAKDL